MRLSVAATLLAVSLFACGPAPAPFEVFPDAELGPPTTKVTPPPGPFNGEVTLTFSSDRPATIFVSTTGADPRTSSVGRLSGPSPFTVKLEKTTTVKYFASVGGKDEELKEGNWIRAGGPVGTISGVVVVGSFAAGKEVGLFHNTTLKRLGKPAMATEIPFTFDKLQSGAHRLTAISDRNDDGQLIPFLDFQSDTTTITLDLADPFKASAENVRIYLGASGTGLGTLKGTILLPKPPSFQNLQISVLDPGALTGGLDPAALFQQLQGGYRILTNQTDTVYPYVITDLKPGRYTPVPSLFGFGNGGVALNLLANPLRPVTIEADQETEANFAFGPVTIGGEITVSSMTAPQGFAYGIVAARAASLTDGMQAVLMPVIFTRDPMTQALKGSYSGAAFRGNASIALRVFVNSGTTSNPITDALAWVINPFAPQQPHATVMTGMTDVVRDITVP